VLNVESCSVLEFYRCFRGTCRIQEQATGSFLRIVSKFLPD